MLTDYHAQYKDTIEGRPDQWTEKLIAEVYRLKAKGDSMLKSKDSIGPNFEGKRNVRVDWKLEQHVHKTILLSSLQILIFLCTQIVKTERL